MLTNKHLVREGGRPRSFENDDVFRATATVLSRLGYSRLSLDAVAQEVAVSGPAISRRFGSKQGLLRAYLAWSIETARQRFCTVRTLHASPLAALCARYLIPFDERPEELSAFTGWLDMRCDDELAPLLQARKTMWEEESASLLAAAREAGELTDCDTGALARSLTAALAGATLLWFPDDEPLLHRYAEILETLLGPYRTASLPGNPAGQATPCGSNIHQ